MPYDAIIQQINNKNENNMGHNNPYLYVKNNDDFDKLVSYGVKALPFLERKLDEVYQDGLYAYIIAITIEEIVDFDFKRNSFKWTKGSEFINEFDTHIEYIKNYQSNKKEITLTSFNEDHKSILALPYVSDKEKENIYNIYKGHKTRKSHNCKSKENLEKEILDYINSKE